ncbi:MAG: hypothetical protein LBB20_03835, partial [Puniceicoccales bacterium]|nr:hypothetical protein [Puniceicoccales bacterium]
VTALEIAEIILEAIKDNNKVDAKIKADYVEVIRQLKDFDEDLDKLLKAIETNDVNEADSIIKGYHNPHVFILLVDTKSKSSKYKGHSALTYSMTKSNEAAQRVKGAIRHLWFNAPRNKSNNLFPGVKIMGSIFSQINDQINKLSTQQLKLRSLLLLISLFDGYSYNSKMNILHIAAVLGNHDCVSFIRKKMIDPSSKIGINWNIYKRKITPSNATMTINLNENEPNSNENESKPKGKECDVKNKSPLELAIFGLNLANLDKLNKIQKDIDDFNEIISLLMQKCLAINMGSTSEPTSHQGELFDIINGDPILKDIDFIGKKHETEPKLLYYTPPLVVGKFEMKENINTKDYITANFNNLPDFIKNNENVKNFIENIKSIKNNKKLTLALVIQRPFKQQDSFNDNSNQLRIVNVNNENTINEGKEVKEILHGELSFFQKVINNVYHFIESLFVPVSKSEECTYKWVDGVGNFFIFSNSDGQPVITYHWITSKITCAFIENELDNLNYKSTKYGYLNVIHNDNNSDDTRVIMAKICSLGNAIDRGIYEILSIRGLEGKKVESLKISDIIDLKNKKHELSYKAVLIIELIEESLDTYYKTEWRQLNSANDSLLPDSIISMLTNLQSNINIVTAILDNTFNLSDNDDDNKYKKNTTANTSFDHINDNVTNGKAKTLLIPFRTTTFYGSAAIPIIETREIEMAPADN